MLAHRTTWLQTSCPSRMWWHPL